MKREEFVQDIKDHVTGRIIPFWKGMRDNENGGYYGLLDYNLNLDKKAVKGCILNSRILWFFSNAYLVLKEESLLAEADHAYAFLQEHCLDKKNGGVYWSVTWDGKAAEGMKHTYNQAFAIYALSSYYRASHKEEALETAKALFRLVEEKCTDEAGYMEAFTEDFGPADNEKLSENGVMADKTMNTLLHLLEAYTELYDVSGDDRVKERLLYMLDLFEQKVYDPDKKRLEVFFDNNWNTLIDLHSFGHDIEASWLIDRACEVLKEDAYTEKMRAVTKELAACVYREAYRNHSLANECEKGVVDDTRVWWVQAESVVGYLNAWQKSGNEEYMQAAQDIWEFIKNYLVDKREGSEWFEFVNADGSEKEQKPIVQPWKCPYHNGRMCLEVIKRLS